MAKEKKASSSATAASRSSNLNDAVGAVVRAQGASKKPFAIVLAGHNGSGKSTMWYSRLAALFRMPLVNADRLMMSILPEANPLPAWAVDLRDTHEGWMRVAQLGVQAFVAQAMSQQVPFAMETVFSHWKRRSDGTYESKIDSIKDMQKAGYFVLLIFVGLSTENLSVLRVESRVKSGGHAVSVEKLRQRFPRTQQAIRAAIPVADASILVDNSGTEKDAFQVCRVQTGPHKIFDVRDHATVPKSVRLWLDKVA